jgi:hypothetical protein
VRVLAAGEFSMQVGQIAGIRSKSEDLVEHREVVGQRVDRTEGDGALGSKGTTGGGEEEGGPDGVEWDAAGGEGGGEETIVA